ncbi:UNVERIFIED_CONTAM: hypothetical protein FKN15_025354 [Acipenser sinensis]
MLAYLKKYNTELNRREERRGEERRGERRGEGRGEERRGEQYYPHADSMLAYLKKYSTELNLRLLLFLSSPPVLSSSSSSSPLLSSSSPPLPLLSSSSSSPLSPLSPLLLSSPPSRSVVLVATGLWVPRQVLFPGSEFLEGYESVSVDPEDFAGQAVLILGKGNSAFETASNLLGTAGHLHLYSRSPVRLAWETHYVGDLRRARGDPSQRGID